MLVRLARGSALLLAGSLLSSCTGLQAGPAVTNSATVPVSRDSAWVRARRGFSAEVMTLDRVDSIGGVITGRRYPKSSDPQTSVVQCQIMVALNVAPSGDGTATSWDTRWVAPMEMASSKPDMCEKEREAVVTRIQQTISPPQ